MTKREKVFNKFGGRCAYCGCKIDIMTFHIDHIKAKSKTKSGTNSIDNYFPACPDCNLCKSDLSIEEFREKLSSDIFRTHHGKLFQKYYGVKPKKIKFYFEEIGHGNI